MKSIKLTSDVLKPLIATIGSFKHKIQQPVLWFKTIGDALFVIATDFITTFGVKIKNVADEWDTLVSAEHFERVIKALSADEVKVIKFSSNTVEFVFSNGARYELGEVVREMPDFADKFASEQFVIVDGEKFAEYLQMAAKVAPKVLVDLDAVLIEKANQGLMMVATDGFRLVWIPIEVDNTETLKGFESITLDPESAVACAAGIQRLMKEVPELETRIEFRRNEAIVSVENDKYGWIWVMAAKRVAFPEWRRVVPDLEQLVWSTFDKNLFVRVHKAVEDLRKLEDRTAVWEIEADRLSIVFEGDSSVFRQLICVVELDDMKIGINTKHVLDAARSYKSNVIKVALEAPERPIVFASDEEEHKWLVMPVRLS